MNVRSLFGCIGLGVITAISAWLGFTIGKLIGIPPWIGGIIAVAIIVAVAVSRLIAKPFESYDKGVDYAIQGDLLKAKEQFQESLRLYPGHDLSKDAIRLIDDVLHEKIKGKTLAHLFTGMKLASQGYDSKAITEIKLAQSLDPNYSGVYSTLGATYRALGRPDEAIAECKMAVALDPDSSMSHYELGAAYKVGGQIDAAIEEYRKALKISPEHGSAHKDLAFCYRDIGDRRHMIEHRDKALALGVNVDLHELNKPQEGQWLRYSKSITDDFPFKDGPRLAWSINCPVDRTRLVHYSRADLVLEGFTINCTACGSRIDVVVQGDSVTVSTYYQRKVLD